MFKAVTSIDDRRVSIGPENGLQGTTATKRINRSR
jgi:hypothetical protein